MAELSTLAGTFTVTRGGASDAPLVLLLHGFPQTRHTWREQVPTLIDAGFHPVAPDQRGYSPGVRPPTDSLEDYHIDRLVQDVLELADAALGSSAMAERTPFHLVGHDWGGQVAWAFASRHPSMLASLIVLSRPHPAAFRRALQTNTDGQRHRSRHHRAFDDPATATRLLDDDCRRLRRTLGDQGVTQAAVDEYLGVLGTEDALEAALAWYRAASQLPSIDVASIEVPTLMIWGDQDATVSRAAAEGTAEFVDARFRFEVLSGAGHFLTDQEPQLVSRLIVEHLWSITSADR